MSESKIEEAILKQVGNGRTQEFNLDLPSLSGEKRRHLKKIMYEFGVKNGKMLFLPVDQGLEHGSGDFFKNPASVDPEFQLKLAIEGGYNGIVFHIGLAKKYWAKKEYKDNIPLILKLNGKTNIPSDAEALSPITATVKDALELGADAVGYTLYTGSPLQERDFIQLVQVRRDAEKAGLPLIVWSYPRGRAVDGKGGKNSFAMVDYAARVANELGADIVKINLPAGPSGEKYDPEGQFKGYNDLLELSQIDQLRWVIHSAGSTGVLISGGSKIGDEDLLNKAKLCLEAGVDGLIFGRNMWQRNFEEALKITKEIKKIMAAH